MAMTLASCANQPTRSAAQAPRSPEFGTWGVETQYITPAIKPGDDFYRHVNKGWLDTAKIPTGMPMAGAFVNLTLRSEQRVQAIIDEQKAQPSAPGTPAHQIASLYASYADTAHRNALGASMLQGEVASILKAADHREIAHRMGGINYPSLVAADAVIDPDKTSHYVLRIEQSGLGLPGREYYLKPDAPYQALRQAYVGHHPMTLPALAAFAPGFDWQAFFTAIKGEAEVFGAASMGTLRAYTAFHYLNKHAPLLSDDWVDAHFDMFSRQLAGIQAQRPLQARTTNHVNAVLDEPVGKLYVARYFTPEAKAEADKLVKFLRLAFRERLAQNEWMDEATRTEAIHKLDAITAKIGYPDQWHDYSTLVIRKDDLVGNDHRYQAWRQRVRRWEWGMNPQEINAYFYRNGAEIVFPAAILQAPFFDPKADPAVNFGAIGMVIGHEMGHGFDDQGSRFDGTGALRNWWSPVSQKNFEQRTRRLVTQFNYGGKAPMIDGLTGDQRFFLSYAQLWRSVMAEGFLRQITLTNAHSPDEFRVNGVVRNFTPWYDAFGIKAGDALYLAPADRINIW